jgi:hypothetical protein
VTSHKIVKIHDLNGDGLTSRFLSISHLVDGPEWVSRVSVDVHRDGVWGPTRASTHPPSHFGGWLSIKDIGARAGNAEEEEVDEYSLLQDRSYPVLFLHHI